MIQSHLKNGSATVTNSPSFKHISGYLPNSENCMPSIKEFIRGTFKNAAEFCVTVLRVNG